MGFAVTDSGDPKTRPPLLVKASQKMAAHYISQQCPPPGQLSGSATDFDSKNDYQWWICLLPQLGPNPFVFM